MISFPVSTKINSNELYRVDGYPFSNPMAIVKVTSFVIQVNVSYTIKTNAFVFVTYITHTIA